MSRAHLSLRLEASDEVSGVAVEADGGAQVGLGLLGLGLQNEGVIIVSLDNYISMVLG